ncbi:MAG: tetratricopeptide repeat protein [Acidobacteriota bacterium]
MTPIRLILVLLALISGATSVLAQTPAGADLARQALARGEAGDLTGAIEELEAARRSPDAPAAVLDALGSLYLKAGRPADALEVLKPRTAIADPDPVVLANAAGAALALGEDDQAEAFLRKAIARAPISRAALMLWDLRTRQERHREAAEVLAPLVTEPAASEIERLDPDLAAKVALGFAKASLATGAFGEAIPSLQRRTRLRPEDQEGWRLLGESLLEAERFDEAREALAEAQRLQEQQRKEQLAERENSPYAGLDLDGLMRLAAERRTAGDLEGALEAVTEGVRLEPRDPRPRMLQVQLLLSLNRPAQALPRAEAMVQVVGEHPWAIYLRGMSRLAAGNPTQGEADLRQVLEVAPNHLPAMNGLASLLLQQGEVDQADQLTRRALELAPDNPRAQANAQQIAERRAQ